MAIADKEEEKSTSEFKIVYFLLTICLQIISFIFLFNYRSTEYIVYIFSFIIFCVSPLIWINDLLAIGNVLNKNSRYFQLFQYKELSLVISTFLLFLGIFFVLLTNEKIRKQKVSQKHKADKIDDWSDDKKPNENLNSLKTSNFQEYESKVILRLYAVVVILSWGMVLETFSESTTFGDKIKIGYEKSRFSELIGSALNTPQSVLNEIDEMIHRQTLTNVSPMMKAFSAYVITFLLLFFGLFMRIPIGVAGVNYHKIHVANMENMFNSKFFRNIDQNRNIALFFASFLISSLLFFFCLLLQKWVPGYFLKIGFVVLTTLIFGTSFGMRHRLDVNGVQMLIMGLLSVLCSLLGTPVLVGMLQFILEIFGKSLITESMPNGEYLIFLFMLFFSLIFSIVMYFGVTWINNDASKRIQIFNAVLVCMAVSLFMGLSTTYHMFTNLYNLLRGILEAVFVYIVPLLIVVMSFFLFAFTFKNHQKELIMTDG